METSQQNLTTNFQSFIQRFQSLNYDFRIAVTTTDAWRGKYTGNNTVRRWKSSSPTLGASGVYVIDKDTPQVTDVFLKNATQGINGSGDERAFESMEDALSYAPNADFRRDGAYLAVIVLSDEDDFSASVSSYQNNNYNSANLYPLSRYVNLLNTNAGAGNYSVNAITILDTNCLATLQNSFTGRLIGQRYIQLAQITGGQTGSLCGDFSNILSGISDTIIAAASKYKLDREPIESTIRVIVNGTDLLKDATNGWSYDPALWEISFHGTGIPAVGANVQISFDPAKPKF